MTDHDHDHDKLKDDLDTDRPSGWAGVDDALGDTTNRPAGPDYGASDRTDADPDADVTDGDPFDRDVTPAPTRDEGL